VPASKTVSFSENVSQPSASDASKDAKLNAGTKDSGFVLKDKQEPKTNVGDRDNIAYWFSSIRFTLLWSSTSCLHGDVDFADWRDAVVRSYEHKSFAVYSRQVNMLTLR